MSELSIALVGAGIGGATAALALQRAGIRAVLYEQAPELGEVGAGLTITPNATRVLDGLGLAAVMEAMADATPHVGTLHYETGERLGYTLRGAKAYLEQYGAIVRHVHRADLHDALIAALDPDVIELRLAHQLARIEPRENEVVLEFTNGNVHRHSLVVASDGLKSVARSQLWGEDDPDFTGYVAWRGLVERERVPHIGVDPHFASFASEGKSFGRYPVRHGSLINYVAMARREGWTTESWSTQADLAEVRAEFAGWHSDVTDILEATNQDQCFVWALHTRKTITEWVKGRVALLGDAAHPMTPFLGMGAAMAIEDGTILGRCLAAWPDDYARALDRYQVLRAPRANAVFEGARRRGELMFGKDPEARRSPPGTGLDDLYRYDAMTTSLEEN